MCNHVIAVQFGRDVNFIGITADKLKTAKKLKVCPKCNKSINWISITKMINEQSVPKVVESPIDDDINEVEVEVEELEYEFEVTESEAEKSEDLEVDDFEVDDFEGDDFEEEN